MTSIINLVRAFNPKWGDDLQAAVEGELRSAVDSIVANRHLLAHGQHVGISYHNIREYYDRVWRMLEILASYCEQQGN